MTNWKTTVTGIFAILGAISVFVVALLDNDPSTVPDISAMVVAITSAIAGIGLIAAKDGDK